MEQYDFIFKNFSFTEHLCWLFCLKAGVVYLHQKVAKKVQVIVPRLRTDEIWLK